MVRQVVQGVFGIIGDLRVYRFIILVWYKIRNKRSPDAIIEEQLTHTSDEQATRFKRRLQEHRERQEREEGKV